MKQENMLRLSETEILKLPFLTKATYIDFRKTNSKSHSHMYAKHRIEKICYKINLVGEVHISKGGSFITGVFCTSNQESLRNLES